MIMNLRYADDIILLATSQAELQELINHLDQVSHKYRLLINIDKTKVMKSDGITCPILIQNEQLVPVNMLPYLGSLITEDGECMTKFRTRLNTAQAIRASLQKIWKTHSIPISTKIRLQPRLHNTTCCQTGCLYTLYKQLSNLSNQLSNQFDNWLYRVYKHSTGCQTHLTTGLTTDCIV